MKTNQTVKIVYGGLFIALTAIGANITAIMPFLVVGGVPITLQTFFAVLAGLVLGSRLGAFTMFGYMLIGLAGAPVFAQFSGGAAHLLSPTFGFIISFIIVAYICGKLVEYKQTKSMYIVASLFGMLFIYVFGTNWLYMAYKLWFQAPEGFHYGIAWLWMSVPLPKDIALALVAGVFAYRLDAILMMQKVRSQS